MLQNVDLLVLLQDGYLLVDGSLEVCVHELEDEVEVAIVLGPVDVQQPDDVWMVTRQFIHQFMMMMMVRKYYDINFFKYLI
jgi:hypothetical protein